VRITPKATELSSGRDRAGSCLVFDVFEQMTTRESRNGEIVHPGLDGRPMFYELMRRRGPFCFYAFDLLWLDDSDLRDRPLLERKSLLRKLVPRHPKSVLYVEHVATGTDLFRVICDRDMERIVAKQASARYTPEATTWVKIKNRQYSQAVGRAEFFDRRRV